MTGFLIAFAAGVLALQWQGALPGATGSWAMLPVAALAVALARTRVDAAQFRTVARYAIGLAACAALGFLWAAHRAHLRMDERLAPALEGRDLEVVGVVASLPAIGERSVRFEFEPESAEVALPPRIQLAWYRSALWQEESPAVLEDASRVHPGERWRFTLRLRRPHGALNPHGFDYEAWLLERGIGATGYVRSRPEPEKLGQRRGLLDRVELAREAIRDRFRATLGDSPAAGILVALAVGDQRAISAEDWKLFNRTGVTHLMSISGLHVTLVSGLFAGLVAWGWRRSARLCERLPARKAAAAAGLVAALGYTLLAGFAVPAQRTFLMVGAVAIALWVGRIASPARVLAIALAAVLVADPWAVLSAGFWLSFGAVALIFFAAAGWSAPASRARQWWDTQWAVTLGLAPAAVFLFAQVSLVGPLANAVAIPLVSVVVTPLALAAAALPLDAPLLLADALVRMLLHFLHWCAALPAAVWQQHAPPLWAVLLAAAGTLWLLMPRGFPSRWAGLALMAPAFALPPPAPREGEAWITVLDVGQGLAAVVRTAAHALAYDAGPMLGPEADSGERIVAPFLRASGVVRLERFVATHHDMDHVGGALSLLAALPVGDFRSSLPSTNPILGVAPFPQACRRGERWNWDGVDFELLYPDAEGAASARKANDASCVLKVTAGGRSMLLTGDIERAAEARLAALDAGTRRLRTDVLLAPHHGSRTSSTPEFLAAVGAGAVVVPVGYRSRFGHPHPQVLARYAAAGMHVHRTDLDGALTVRLGPALAIESERAARARYWLAKPRPPAS